MYYVFCDKYLKNQYTAEDTIHKISDIDMQMKWSTIQENWKALQRYLSEQM